jgi:hypothetical protein
MPQFRQVDQFIHRWQFPVKFRFGSCFHAL